MSEPQPLRGLRVVVTRAAQQAGGLATRLRALGADPIVYPTIAYAPPEDPAPLAAALERLAAGAYDWLVLTSVTAVRAVAAGLGASLVTRHASLRVAAVGSATAAACAELLGLEPTAVPEKFVAAELAATLGDLALRCVLLPNADIAPPTLAELLVGAGASVERVVAYRTIPAPDGAVDMAGLLAAGQIDAITFTSGSTARAFAQKVGPAGLAHARRAVIACIGPSTAAVCREVGLAPVVVAAVSTEAGLVAALAEHLGAVALGL